MLKKVFGFYLLFKFGSSLVASVFVNVIDCDL